MDVTVGCFAHAKRSPVSAGLAHGLHLHVEAGLLSAGDVEGSVAVSFVALDAGAGAALLTDIAGQLPAGGRDVLDAVDGLQEDRISKTHLKEKREMK